MKKIYTTLLLMGIFCSAQFSFAQWNQVGNPEDGGGLATKFGQAVDITNDGNIIAVGDYFADPSSTSNAGMVRVYEKVNGSWVQLGNTIEGETAQEFSGWSLSMNADGTRIAVGAYGYDAQNTDDGIVRVYYLNGNTWQYYSSPLSMRGENQGDNAGWSVSMSGDGDRVAIGSRLNDDNGSKSGHVRVFDVSNGTWDQVGPAIAGEGANDRFGYSVSMNHDGTIFAAGGRFNSGNGSSAGHVRVFEESGNNWSQLGTDLDGEAASDNFGSAVSIDSVGNTLVVGARRNDENGSNAGHARVFEYSGGSWSQIGNDLDGDAAGNEFGYSVAINPAGTVIAVGEPESNTGTNTGQVKAYYNNNGTWTQLGSTLLNQANYERLGWAVALSSDTSLVMGDPRSFFGAAGRAVVQKYGCLPTSGTETVTACDSYTWTDGNGNTYTSSTNSATHTLQNSQGCDSVVTLDLTINNSNSGTDVVTACDSYDWIDGNTYTANNNSATHTLMNVQGCDSVVTLDLTITNSNSGTETVTACDSYTWTDGNGNTYTSSTNSATHTLQNSQGCDSVVTLDLTINNSNSGTDVVTACDSYDWIDGNTYTANNNSATHTLMNVQGCDSVVTLDLTITNSNSGTETVTACDSYTWTGGDGNTYTTSTNSATHTFTNSQGCDSVVTLDLTINNSNSGTDVVTACNTYTWIDGNTYTANNNSATHTLMNVQGCDSVVTLDLTINTVDVSTTNNDPSITANAAGASYQWLDCNDNDAPVGGETGQTFTATNNGSYAVEVTQNGCTDTSSCVTILTTSLGDLSAENEFQVFPNPASDNISIITQEVDYQVEIYNELGMRVLSARNKETLSLGDLSAGIYLLRLSNSDGSPIGNLKKLVVR